MNDDNKTVFSASEEVDILYNLKNLVRRYRAHEVDGKLTGDILKNYTKAASVAAKATELPVTQIFSDTLITSKDYIITQLETSDIEQIKLTPQIISMADEQTIADFDAVHRQISSIDNALKTKQSELQKLENPSNVRTKKQTSATNFQDNATITSIKEEISAIIAARYNGDKDMLATLSSCEYIETTLNSNRCTFKVGEYEFKTSLAINGISLEANQKSRYGKITPAALKELSAIKRPKKFLTAIGEANVKQAKAADKKIKDDKAKAEKIAKQKETLNQEITALAKDRETAVRCLRTAVQAIVKKMDGCKLFEALALDNSAGKSLLKSLLSNQVVGGHQDKLRGCVLDGAIYSPKVWKLYEAPANKRQSYYQKAISNIIGTNRATEISDTIGDFMSDYDNQSSNQEMLINKIAGFELPREIAKDIFLQEVFSQGMSLSHADKFSDKRFTAMNKILSQYGYRISFSYIKTEKDCSEAKPVSDNILEDMHTNGCKRKKNKQIALLARIGEVRKLAPKADISNPKSNQLISSLYKSFVDCYFGGNNNDAYIVSWQKFIRENQKQSDDLYRHLSDNAPSPEHLKKWLNALGRGEYIVGEDRVQKQTSHHVFERKYGGLFSDCEVLFNNEDNVASTISFHPSDADPHRLAHLFDTKEIYFTVADGQYIKHNSIKSITKDSMLAIPHLEIKGKDGKYHPAIDSNTLLITSQGLTITQPMVAGSGLRENLSTRSQKKSPSDNNNSRG